jgi:Na+/proline symporter
VFTVAQVLVRSLIWLPIGLGLLVVFPPSAGLSLEAMKADREATYVLGMRDLLPAGALGLMLTGMLAALASTVDTHLNWGASYWTNDIYKRFVCQSWRKVEPSPRHLVWVARLSNLVILTIALGVMTRLDSIQTAWHASLLLGAGMGVLLVLRWIWWRITAWGEIAAILASFVLVPVLLRWVPGEALRLLVMAAGSTLAGIVVSLAFGAEPVERLQEFYSRAEPPGFWGPIALACGREPARDARRLGRGLATVVLSALSIFSLLTGIGSWLSGSPAPTWMPWRSLWLVAVTTVGLVLVPVWWRLGFRSAHSSGK